MADGEPAAHDPPSPRSGDGNDARHRTSTHFALVTAPREPGVGLTTRIAIPAPLTAPLSIQNLITVNIFTICLKRATPSAKLHARNDRPSMPVLQRRWLAGLRTLLLRSGLVPGPLKLATCFVAIPAPARCASLSGRRFAAVNTYTTSRPITPTTSGCGSIFHNQRSPPFRDLQSSTVLQHGLLPHRCAPK